MRNALILGLPIAFLIFDSTAEALVIKPNYSKLGSVYQDNDGLIYTAPGAGRVDVTADIKANIETVIAAWQNAILIPAWTEEVTFTIGKPSKADRAGETTLSGAVDGNMRPTSAQTILDDSADTKWFIDKTPNDNSEFDKIQLEYSMGPETGGKETNVARYAAAVDRGPADHKLDLFTVVEHEIEHALGFYAGLKRYDNLSAGNKLKIPTTISGAPSDFDLPIITDVAHINNVAEQRLFSQTVESNAPIDLGLRRFISDIDKLAICTIEGCTMPNQVPEPKTWVLLLTGLGCLLAAWRTASAIRLTQFPPRA